MAPLNKQLSGLILPHDTFGNHLDNQSKTIDNDLELKNFAAAGELLASVWSEIVLDNFPVVAKFIHPNSRNSVDSEIDDQWFADHVQESQYFLQVMLIG